MASFYVAVPSCVCPYAVPPGFHRRFSRLLWPKMPEFAAAFLKNCDVSCDVLSVFVAMKLRETVKIAKKLHFFFFVLYNSLKIKALLKNTSLTSLVNQLNLPKPS